MDPTLIDYLHAASTALQRGASQADVDRIIKQNTGLENLNALKLAVSTEGQSGQAEARDLAEVADRGALVNTAGGAANMGSFGLVDDLLGALGADQAGASFKSGIQQNRRVAPGASMAAEGIGGVAGPGLAMGAALSKLPAAVYGMRSWPMVRMGLASAAGGAAGAAEGALFGFGEAEGPLPERAREAVGPSLVGGFAGGMLGAGGEAARLAGPPIKSMFRRRGPHIAREMVDRTNLGPGINPIKADIDRQLTEVQETYFKPLDAQFEEVTDLPIVEFFRRMAEEPQTRSQMRSVLPAEIVETFRTGFGDAASAPIPKFSFSNVQDLRTRLRGDRAGRFDAEASELSGLMDEAFGEQFQQGNREWARVQRRADAVSLGERAGQNFGHGPYAEKLGPVNTAERLQRALAEMPPEVHQDFLTAHMHTNYIVPLNSGDGGKIKDLFQAIPEGGAPEIEATLRSYFQTSTGAVDEAAYRQFREMLRTERSGARIASAFKKLAPLAAGFGIGGYLGVRAAGGFGDILGLGDAVN